MAKRQNRSQPIDISIKYPKGRRKTPHQTSTFKIGEVAKISHIPVVTLRNYENQGLIQSVVVDELRGSNHRRFSKNILLELEFIQVCRSTGFSIPQIKSLMKLFRGFRVPSKARMSALRRSIDLINEQMKKLQKIEKILRCRTRHPDESLTKLLQKFPELFRLT